MPSLPTRQLGKNGPIVPVLGLGTMGLSAFSGQVLTDEERFKVLDRAYELGSTFWDTEAIYGDSEELLGRWFTRTGKRREIFVATKFAGSYTGDVQEGKFNVRGDPAFVKESCEMSLQRLGVSHFDLFYCHRLDLKSPIEHTVKATAELKAEGKIHHLGLCEVSPTTLRRAHAIHPISAVQIEYSPFTVDIERSDMPLISTCRSLGTAIVAYSPLSRGFLTGTIKSPHDFEEGDVRKYYPRFSEENFDKNLKLVDDIRVIAEEKGVTPAQVTLAWLMAQGEDIFPIPGTRKVKYLEENMGAVNVHLNKSEIARIHEVVDNAEVHGERYPETMAHGLFAESPALEGA